jgi:starvation-inducible DNA-binding protein
MYFQLYADSSSHIRSLTKGEIMLTKAELISPQEEPILTRSDIEPKAVRQINAALNTSLADVFTLYLKTKNFHWHMSGPHFRDFHLLVDEQAEKLFAMRDEGAERDRHVGGTTIRWIGQICRLQRISGNDADFVTPKDMLSELHEDNKALTLSMRALDALCNDSGDVAPASLLENWIDESQLRSWFLFEATRE